MAKLRTRDGSVLDVPVREDKREHAHMLSAAEVQAGWDNRERTDFGYGITRGVIDSNRKQVSTGLEQLFITEFALKAPIEDVDRVAQAMKDPKNQRAVLDEMVAKMREVAGLRPAGK